VGVTRKIGNREIGGMKLSGASESIDIRSSTIDDIVIDSADIKGGYIDAPNAIVRVLAPSTLGCTIVCDTFIAVVPTVSTGLIVAKGVKVMQHLEACRIRAFGKVSATVHGLLTAHAIDAEGAIDVYGDLVSGYIIANDIHLHAGQLICKNVVRSPSVSASIAGAVGSLPEYKYMWLRPVHDYEAVKKAALEHDFIAGALDLVRALQAPDDMVEQTKNLDIHNCGRVHTFIRSVAEWVQVNQDKTTQAAHIWANGIMTMGFPDTIWRF
jgi:hypothetical protein